MPTITKIIAAFLAATALQANALQITSLSPQDETSPICQVIANFDGRHVNFGDPKAPAPLSLSCSDARLGEVKKELRGAGVKAATLSPPK